MDSLQNLATSDKLDHELALSSLPPTPSKSATAFTIEFDDLNNNLLKNGQKKNFERGNSLRDSLRKYAPKKLEKLTKLKSKDDVKNVDAKGNSNHAVDSDRNLSDGASFLIQRMFSAQKVAKQPTNNSNKSVDNQLDTRISSSCKSTPIKMRNFNFNNLTSKTNGPSFRSPPPLEMDSGVCADEDDNSFLKQENAIDDEDALSETGTYTVELDNQDPIAEEARKRIDEIFGTKETKVKQHLDSMSNSSNSSSKPTSKQSFKISSIKKIYQDARHSSERDSKINSEKQRKNSTSSTERLSLSNRRTSLPQQSSVRRQDSFSKSSVSRLSVGKQSNSKPLTSTNKKSQLNQNISLISQKNTFVFNCNNNESSNSLLNRARANSITRSFSKKGTRKDQLKDDDTGSMKSEGASTGSTDLSSINSEKCKSDSGQQASTLRFNRAFALRRARLGIDTPPLPNSNNFKNVSNSSHKSLSSNKPNSVASHIPITSTNQHQSRAFVEFDRSDGGRYSLRASSTSAKPPINGQRFALASKPKHHLQQASSNSLNRHETSSLISAISTSKSKVVNKMIKKNSFVIDDADYLKSNHTRANSFGGGPLNNLTNNQMKSIRLSSAASTSSNNTMSNASTSEDLSNISDQMNVKNLQHLSPFQLGRRIYSTKPHYVVQTNSFRSKLEENGSLYMNGSNESAPCDQPQSTESTPLHSLDLVSKKFGQLSTCSTPQPTNHNFNFNNSSNKSLSALDYLVLGAAHQLSFKLRCKLRSILDAEKSKYPIDNENRILIEELLPQVNVTEYRNSETSEKTISRDLSNVLKNLKRIEQSLEVINLLLESNSFMKSIDSTNELCNTKDALLTNEDNFSLEI